MKISRSGGRMADGSQILAVYEGGPGPADISPDVLRTLLEARSGWNVDSLLTDHATELHIDFTVRNHRFSLFAQFREWTLCGYDPVDETLASAVASHVEEAIHPAGAAARAGGSIAEGSYRVVWACADGSAGRKDFNVLADAVLYANDAASETENGPTWASVFDCNFRLVQEGRHYGRPG